MNKIQVIIKTCTQDYIKDNFTLLYDQIKIIEHEHKYEEYKEEIKEVIHLIVDYLLYGEKNDADLFE